MRARTRRAARVGCALALLGAALQVQAQHPADRWEFAVEAGHLRKVRNNSPLDYRIVPAQVAWRSPAMFEWWRN